MRDAPRATERLGDVVLALDMGALEAHALDCLASAAAAVQQAHGKVLAVGVCTFWHAFVGVDGAGHAVTPIYLWNDNRSGDQAIQLRRQLDEAAVHARTGCY